MELLLKRDPSNGACTLGDLYVDSARECFCLEDVVREVPGVAVADWKLPGATAIPSGRYRVVLDFSQRFQRIMPHVLDVPGFAGIRIHPGNSAVDTEGCILVGSHEDGNTITHSRDAFEALFAKLQSATDEIWLTIRNHQSAQVVTA